MVCSKFTTGVCAPILALTLGIALAGSALADATSDALAGLAAMGRGDNAGAVRLFTQAINSGQLPAAELELAYVKRAEAYLAAGDAQHAQTDARVAVGMDPNDGEAASALRESQAAQASVPPPQAAQTLWGATAVALEPNHFPLPRVTLGAAWGRADLQQAINDAIADCQQAGGRTYCRMASTWSHGCNYISGGYGLLFSAWNTATSPDEAQRACSKRVMATCKPPVGGCNP